MYITLFSVISTLAAASLHTENHFLSKNTHLAFWKFLLTPSKNTTPAPSFFILPSLWKLFGALNLDCNSICMNWFSKLQQWQISLYACSKVVEPKSLLHSTLGSLLDTCFTSTHPNNTVSLISSKSSKNSNLLFSKIMICFMKILLCWLQCNLNRGKWLIIERVTSILSLVAKYVFACFSIVSID